jgi:phospholipid/cholesterol/gamma-HCH transport system substrate-binding protein
MSRNAVETVMGAVVLVVAAVFLFFAYSTSQVRATSGVTYTAQFTRVDGIRDGTDVRISGVKVGQVVSQTLDPKTFLAIMTLSVDPALKLGKETTASIKMSGLLGDKYIDLDPGFDDEVIPPGGRIEKANSGIDLEQIIGTMIFGQTSKKDSNGAPTPEGGAAPAPQGGAAPAPAEGGNAPAAPKP